MLNAAVRSSRRLLVRFEKRQYLAVVSSAQFRKAVLDKLHHLTPVELVLFDGLCDEGEAGFAAGLYQLAGAVGLYPDVTRISEWPTPAPAAPRRHRPSRSRTGVRNTF